VIQISLLHDAHRRGILVVWARLRRGGKLVLHILRGEAEALKDAVSASVRKTMEYTQRTVLNASCHTLESCTFCSCLDKMAVRRHVFTPGCLAVFLAYSALVSAAWQYADSARYPNIPSHGPQVREITLLQSGLADMLCSLPPLAWSTTHTTTGM
jgi:hypothetical protein